MVLGRPSPHPGFGTPVELPGSDAGGLLDLAGIGEALSGEGIATEEAPPALLQVEPTGTGGNKHVIQAGMPFQPGARLQATVAREIVADDKDVTGRIVGFAVSEQRDVALGVARSRTARQLLPIAHAQRSVDPSPFWPPAVIQLGFEAMAIG